MVSLKRFDPCNSMSFNINKLNGTQINSGLKDSRRSYSCFHTPYGSSCYWMLNWHEPVWNISHLKLYSKLPIDSVDPKKLFYHNNSYFKPGDKICIRYIHFNYISYIYLDGDVQHRSNWSPLGYPINVVQIWYCNYIQNTEFIL